ncbi:serine hydrolase domain-containing protein [Paenibacillus agilis]|uniref:Beta-lactamase family protein n=1 Tax=Paenibacillus agilis TaxID=3020863 RepID=A0A559IXS1_9BACL|nr:serine hydrolase domain-containing protein [Paenibacillus agilis]TVX92381.1 beta-lactamase family protein [Paenibacillus agilis]
MKKELTQSLLDDLVAQAIQKKHIYGAVICVEKGDGSLSLVSGAGNIQAETPYFIASITKMYVTAVLLKLRSKGQLQLEDKISRYLSQEIMNKLHVQDGVDYSNDITIKHLLSNTSGIPTYFTSEFVSELISGKDQAWSLDKTLDVIKSKKPSFKPGQKGKAHYSDPNFHLLGTIVENITGQSIHEVFQAFIFDELQLAKTYVFEDVNDVRPVPIYYKKQPLYLPHYISSIASEGGIVSTAQDSMLFLKAFFNGRLFPKTDLAELTSQWNLLFGPGLFYYGIGICKQPIAMFNWKKGIVGHWGQSGAFAFYHEETDLYFTGTVNQYTGHSVAARMMMKVIKMMEK